MTTTIHVAHSPDSDDAFMFYALARDKIATGDYQKARTGTYEVTAISIHAYAHLADKYILLPHGASMGDNYGPLVVAREAMDAESLKGKRIAIPGEWTSAYLSMRLFQPEFEAVMTPFDQIGDDVLAGKADAGVIIHEGQLTYEEEGLHKVVDLGEWWYEITDGLPLPLGGNAIRRDLGPDAVTEVSRLLKESIQYSLDHRQEALDYAMEYARGMDTDRADRFVGMYVNELTLDYGDRGREAVKLFLERGAEIGMIPQVDVEFAG